MISYCSQVPPRGVFVRTMHEQSQAIEAIALTAGAKMSALCSFCVHHVAVNQCHLLKELLRFRTA